MKLSILNRFLTWDGGRESWYYFLNNGSLMWQIINKHSIPEKSEAIEKIINYYIPNGTLHVGEKIK